jgi:hypothetical protein
LTGKAPYKSCKLPVREDGLRYLRRRGCRLRAAIGEAGDADTNDLLIAFSRALDKHSV